MTAEEMKEALSVLVDKVLDTDGIDAVVLAVKFHEEQITICRGEGPEVAASMAKRVLENVLKEAQLVEIKLQ